MPTALLWFRRDPRPADHRRRRALRRLGAGPHRVPARYGHAPWLAPDGYPLPVVDHAEARRVALERYQQVRGR